MNKLLAFLPACCLTSLPHSLTTFLPPSLGAHINKHLSSTAVQVKWLVEFEEEVAEHTAYVEGERVKEKTRTCLSHYLIAKSLTLPSLTVRRSHNLT
jgi:hypothetical protein